MNSKNFSMVPPDLMVGETGHNDEQHGANETREDDANQSF